MKQPQPFYRPKKNRWYVQLDGKQINLGPDEAKAWATYHEIMTERSKSSSPAQYHASQTNAPLVVSVLDQFLDWLEHRVAEGSKAQRTYDWYYTYLQSFATFKTPAYRVCDLSIDRLEPIHVYQWVDAQAGWKTGKRGAMTAVQRACNWAAKAGLLKAVGGKSPLVHLEKPAQGRREQLITFEEYRKIIAIVRDQNFKDLLELSWETGVASIGVVLRSRKLRGSAGWPLGIPDKGI